MDKLPLMYPGAILSTATDQSAAVIGASALSRRLTVYAGAGLSAAPPASLPGAATLSKRIADDLSNVVELSDVDQWDLIAVADRVAESPSGLRLLHEAIARAASFGVADPNYAHEVLALLICEGVATVLEANYDTCIERGAMPELLPVAIDDRDRISVATGALLKVHGCITRPGSMLATSAELANPPLYASVELAARLSMGDVAFVGLGSPADYVRSSVTDFVSRVSSSSLTLVDPNIDDWDSNGWQQIVPDLDPTHRVAMTADEFCDHVLRFYTRDILRRLRLAVASLPDQHPQRSGIETLIQALERCTAVRALKWLRSLVWRLTVGESVISSSRVLQGLLAIAMLSSGHERWRFLGRGLATTPDADVALVLVVADHAPTGSEMANEAERRVGNARAEGLLPDGCHVVVVCHGHHGRLGPSELVLPRGATIADLDSSLTVPDDHLLGGTVSDHIIDSILVGSFSLLTGDNVIDIA